VKIYADTSFFVSLYISDANSERADVWRRINPVALDFTGFHRVEFRNAISLAVFQKRLSPMQAQSAWSNVRRDLEVGVLASRPDIWTKVLQEGESLVQHHTPVIGCRTLDILHVAAALVLDATDFLSFDHRQVQLANLAGLRQVQI
jgi:hypothetical protein